MQIQEEYRVLAASLEAVASTHAAAAAKLRADYAAKATETKERYEAAVSEAQASLAALMVQLGVTPQISR